MILVTGATGTIGQKLVSALSAQGARFKVLVRDAARAAPLGCEYVVGDFDAPETVQAALVGVDRLFLNGSVGPNMVRQHSGVIDAARAAGVERVVNISSRSAEATSSMTIARTHGQIDDHLKGSGLAWATLQPGAFMQNVLYNVDSIRREGKIYGAYKDGRISFVDCTDIAACAASLLTEPRGARFDRAYVLTGREALSYAELASQLSAALHKPVTYVDLPVEQLVEGMKSNGVPAQFAEQMGRLMVLFSEGGGAPVFPGVQEVLGREPRTFRQFAADSASAFG